MLKIQFYIHGLVKSTPYGCLPVEIPSISYTDALAQAREISTIVKTEVEVVNIDTERKCQYRIGFRDGRLITKSFFPYGNYKKWLQVNCLNSKKRYIDSMF